MPAAPLSASTQQSAWYVGLIYTLVTVLSWATLPLALAISLRYLDVWSITWFRMSIAALLLGGWLGIRGELRFAGKAAAGKASWWQSVYQAWPGLLAAALLLTGNYIFYMLGLDRTTPANSQVLIQLAPLLLALGGMVFFGERYNRRQWLGFVILISGLLLFFRNQLIALNGGERYQLGVIFMLLSAVSWASYALVQKHLMRIMSSMQIMLFIYCFATLLMLPMTDFPSLILLDGTAWLWLIFCGLNTLVAYSAFGEALHHWQASRVSAVISITPLATIGVLLIVASISPGLAPPEKLNAISLLAAVLVVIGSMITSLAGRTSGQVDKPGKPGKPAAVIIEPSRS